MARGGYRPAAGRPRGASGNEDENYFDVSVDEAGEQGAQSPLEYMLAIMNNPAAHPSRRDKMAVAAAPYVHARAADSAPGKKQEAEQAALTAERGTSWDSLLN